MNCVAWLHDGILETWSGPSVPHLRPDARRRAAEPPMDKVVLYTRVSSGSFGERANGESDFTIWAINVAGWKHTIVGQTIMGVGRWR